jgi:RNA polymerase sigma factor (sigma-70 family)
MTRRRRWWSIVKLADVESDSARPGLSQEASTDLRRAVARLSPDERLPLVLYFYLDLPLDEVARTLRVSPAAAKSRIYRAARRLRSDLTLEEVS